MQQRPLWAAAGALVALSATSAPAHATGLDAAFGTAGFNLTPLATGASDRYQGTIAAPGGGTYNVGYTTVAGNNRAFVLTKVTDAGKLDTGFGIDGVATLDVNPGPFIAGPNAPSGAAQPGPNGSSEVARGVAVQSDGKIIVSGQAETLQDGSKPDSRDADIYVARFRASGILDTTFGVGGIARLDLSDGITQFTGTPATTTLNGDQSWGLQVRPDNKIVVIGARGTDTSAPAITDRNLAIAQLSANGIPDGGFGTGGVVTAATPGLNENPRGGIIAADGAVIATGYGNLPGAPVRPYLFKVNAAGIADASWGTAFGTAGVASGAVGGPAPGFAEVYDIVPHNGGYALGGYGQAQGSTSIDAVVYRFTAAGVWDESFGTGGIAKYDRAGGQDRVRDITTLPDGRIAAFGSTATDATNSNVNGNVFVVKADGTPDTSVGEGGSVQVDFGGPGDALWSVTPVGDGYKLVGAGFLGGATGAADDAAIARFDFTVPKVDPPKVDPPKTETPKVDPPKTTPIVAITLKPKTTAPKTAVLGKTVTVKIKLTGATGKITYKVDGKASKSATIKSGTAKLSLKGLKAGKRKITWTFAGSEAVKAAKGSFTITIKKK